MLTARDVRWTYISAGFAFLSSVLLVRLLGVEARGQFAILFAVVNSALAISTFSALERSAQQGRIYRQVRRDVLVALGISCIAVLYAYRSAIPVSAVTVIGVLAWGATSLVSSAQLGVLKSAGDITRIAAIRAVFSGLSVVFLVGISASLSGIDSAFVAYAAANVFAVWLGAKYLSEIPHRRPQRVLTDSPKAIAITAVIASVLVNAEAIIGAHSASATEVGLYFSAKVLFAVATPLSGAIATNLYAKATLRIPLLRTVGALGLALVATIGAICVAAILAKRQIVVALDLSAPFDDWLVITVGVVSASHIAAMWVDEIFKARNEFRVISFAGTAAVLCCLAAGLVGSGLLALILVGLISSLGRIALAITIHYWLRCGRNA